MTQSFQLVGPYDFGGVLTNTNRDVVNGETVQKRNQAQKEMHWWEMILKYDGVSISRIKFEM